MSKGAKWSMALVVLAMGGATVCCLLYAHFLNRDPRPKTLYCWLRFSEVPNARVLVRCDGPAISIDANGDGRFDAGERFTRDADCKDVAIASRDEQVRYTITFVDYDRLGTPPWATLRVYLDIQGPRRFHQVGNAEMATTERAAAEIPFDGPLAIRAPFGEYFRQATGPRAPIRLRKRGQPNHLQVDVGTFAAKGGAVVRPDMWGKSAFPLGVHPIVEIEYPPSRPDGPRLRERYPLDGFC